MCIFIFFRRISISIKVGEKSIFCSYRNMFDDLNLYAAFQSIREYILSCDSIECILYFGYLIYIYRRYFADVVVERSAFQVVLPEKRGEGFFGEKDTTREVATEEAETSGAVGFGKCLAVGQTYGFQFTGKLLYLRVGCSMHELLHVFYGMQSHGHVYFFGCVMFCFVHIFLFF